MQDRFDMCGKTRNIVIQLVLHHCCVTSCVFFVARFPVALVCHAANPPLLLVTQPAGIFGKGPSKASASRELQETSIRGILCSPQGEPVPVSKIMMYSRAVESDAKNARGMGRDRTVPSPDRSRLICAWIVLSRHVPTTSLLSENLAQATQGILVHYLPDPTWWYRTVTPSVT